MKYLMLMAASILAGVLGSSEAWAVDSYRYLHVTIDTPWTIFVFLFFLVFAPMILAVFLYWRSAMQRKDEQDEEDAGDTNA